MKILEATALVALILAAVYVVLLSPSSPFVLGVRPAQPEHRTTSTAPSPAETPAPMPTPAPPPLPPPAPREISHTFAFMPGQYLDIPNRTFRKIEIHSQFPIRVTNSHCHLDYGVEFACISDPSDLFITDLRQRPVFSTPQGNMISIDFVEF